MLNGNFHSRLYVNSNGGLHGSKSQVCSPDNTFATYACDFSNSYFDVIAGYLTDLNPVQCPGANISSSSMLHPQLGTVLSIQYENFCYYGTQYSNSFRISLFSDGHIELLFDKIIKIDPYPYESLVISGIRPSEDSSILILDQSYFCLLYTSDAADE